MKKTKKMKEKELAIKAAIQRGMPDLSMIQLHELYKAVVPFMGRFTDEEEARRDAFVKMGAEVNQATQKVIMELDAKKDKSYDVGITGLGMPIQAASMPDKKFQIQLHIVNVNKKNFVVPGTVVTGSYTRPEPKPAEMPEKK